jgi:hypothetical protein
VISTAKVDSGTAQVVLMVIQDDIRHVHIRATASLAIAAVFVTQIPLEDLQGLPVAFRVFTFIGIAFLSFAAVFNFMYTHRLNLVRVDIARALAGGDATSVINSWVVDFRAPWQEVGKPIRWYVLAQTLFAVGSVALGAVIWKLLFP